METEKIRRLEGERARRIKAGKKAEGIAWREILEGRVTMDDGENKSIGRRAEGMA